ncbi:MAG: hypothetical protein ACREA4_01415 [Nitrososphaera sp.]
MNKCWALPLIFWFAAMMLSGAGSAFADPLQNAAKQRIGNYDVEMTTDPINPSAGTPAKILLRIAGVNGDDLVDVPIAIRIVKDGNELQRTDQIFVPYGHYTHGYSFAENGRYVLYVDLQDHAYSGETLTFTFFINVGAASDYFYLTVPLAGAIGAIALLLAKKKKQRMTK